MSEQEEARKGGKGRFIALLATLGAIIAVISFWRRRSREEEEEE
ncbi:MAG TPA: hypothetical protein VNL15_05960 [Dehalococcoidia bacterium]|nr:hypothetical protein [Dehalococcoidia bacterium]